MKRYIPPTPDPPVEYQYDPFGKRVKKSVNGVNEHYIYDGIRMGSDVLADYDNSLDLKTKYVMHPKRIDSPLLSVIPAQAGIQAKYHYYRDGLGSVIALADESANIKNTYKYYAFGGSRSKIETIENRYQYTSRGNDKENNLFYYRSRMYDQNKGRFLQQDKYFIIHFKTWSEISQKKNKTTWLIKNISPYLDVLHAIINSRCLNLFLYNRNNPINFLDPYGYDTPGDAGPPDSVGLGGGEPGVPKEDILKENFKNKMEDISQDNCDFSNWWNRNKDKLDDFWDDLGNPFTNPFEDDPPPPYDYSPPIEEPPAPPPKEPEARM